MTMSESACNYPIQSSAFMDKIIKVVSYETGFAEETICAKNRKREVVEARQLAMRLSKHFTNASLANIGRRIGMKDHATVLHSCKTINNLCFSDRKFSARYDALVVEVAAAITGLKDYSLVCKTCGSRKIQVREWVDANTRKFIDQNDKQLAIDNWCEICQSPTTILTYVEYLEYEEDLEASEETERIKEISDGKYEQQLTKLEKSLGV